MVEHRRRVEAAKALDRRYREQEDMPQIPKGIKGRTKVLLWVLLWTLALLFAFYFGLRYGAPPV